ncbi:MAG TPA: type II secretion system F family protein [Pirellulaceae bacterium]|jgi:type II secretory pathway component PulF
MKFQYTAKDRLGKPVTGEIEADTEVEARRRLRADKVFLVSIAPAAAEGARPLSGNVFPSKRVSRTELVTMMSQLTLMCQSGVDVAEALRNLSQQSKPGKLKDVLARIYDDVSSGESLSQAMTKHPDVFDRSFVAGIAAGERSGDMVGVLQRLTVLVRNEARLISSIWALLTYPILLCLVMGVVLAAVVFYVLPQFGKVFESLGHKPPPLTQFLLDVGTFARGHYIAIMIAAAIFAVALAIFRRQSVAQRLWDYAVLHFVVVRNATRALITGRILRLLGTMLQSGVPLLDCVRLCRSASKSQLFHGLFDAVEHDLLQGQAISRAFHAATFLPDGAAQMIATAEKNGRLGPVLQTMGEHYEEQGETKIRDLVKILEPAMIVGLGVVVAGVVMAIMLPLFDASTMAH